MLDVGLGAAVAEPSGRDQAGHLPEHGLGDLGGEGGVSLGQVGGPVTQDVLAGIERPPGIRGGPVVMEVQRRAVVDEPDGASASGPWPAPRNFIT